MHVSQDNGKVYLHNNRDHIRVLSRISKFPETNKQKYSEILNEILNNSLF